MYTPARGLKGLKIMDSPCGEAVRAFWCGAVRAPRRSGLGGRLDLGFLRRQNPHVMQHAVGFAQVIHHE
jgi:hypothetical protein